MTTMEQILKHALRLSEAERAVVAEKLIVSLKKSDNEVTTQEWNAQWNQELKSRSDSLHDGTAKTISYEEMNKRIKQLSSSVSLRTDLN